MSKRRTVSRDAAATYPLPIYHHTVPELRWSILKSFLTFLSLPDRGPFKFLRSGKVDEKSSSTESNPEQYDVKILEALVTLAPLGMMLPLTPEFYREFVNAGVTGDIAKRVDYDISLDAHRIVFGSDGFLYKGGVRYTSLQKGEGATVVRGPDGNFYAFDEEMDSRLKAKLAIGSAKHKKHSSFFRGERLWGALTWKVQGGKIITMEGISGHTRPSNFHLLNTVLAIPEKFFSDSAKIVYITDVKANLTPEKSSGCSRSVFIDEFYNDAIEHWGKLLARNFDTAALMSKLPVVLLPYVSQILSDQNLQAKLSAYAVLSSVQEFPAPTPPVVATTTATSSMPADLSTVSSIDIDSVLDAFGNGTTPPRRTQSTARMRARSRLIAEELSSSASASTDSASLFTEAQGGAAGGFAGYIAEESPSSRKYEPRSFYAVDEDEAQVVASEMGF